jgi:hypothetical protein
MSTTNPGYAKVCELLDSLVNWPNDQSILGAPHGLFWRTTDTTNYLDLADFLKITTTSWGVAGNLVTPGNASQSNLYLALSGTTPFDGKSGNPPQMPDTGLDPSARHATSDEQTMVQTWINNGAPA